MPLWVDKRRKRTGSPHRDFEQLINAGRHGRDVLRQYKEAERKRQEAEARTARRGTTSATPKLPGKST